MSVVALATAGSLLVVPACSSSSKTSNSVGIAHSVSTTTATSSPTSSADRVKFAKARFVANVSLAAGAAYQWIYKPFKAGTFKSGAKGRTAALVKGALAGAFIYNRLKAAMNDAKGDPLLSKIVAPLSKSVESLKNLPSKIRGGNATGADFNEYTNVVDSLKNAGSSQGLNVTNQVPNASQLTQMVNS
jgi:hypothetical protein